MDSVHSDIALGVRTDTYMNRHGEIAVKRSQDVEEVMKAVHRENMETGGHKIDGLGRHVGELPLTVLMDYCERIGIRWEAVLYTNDYNHVLTDCLKSSEYRKFRTSNK